MEESQTNVIMIDNDINNNNLKALLKNNNIFRRITMCGQKN